MKAQRFIGGYLINAETKQAIFLTFALFLMLVSRLSHADSLPAVEAAQLADEKAHLGEVTSYIRQQSLQGMSLLPSEARTVAGWFSGSWHAMQMSGDDNDNDAAPPPVKNKALGQQASFDDGQGANMIANFHHKGFLPTHDALMIGGALKQTILDDKLQLTTRPFVGQSWDSLRSYWGTEVSLNIAQHDDGLPWGQITAGYIGGEESLTDHGRGIDLHGDVDLTNGWQFTSGMRQSSVTGDANYLMIKWKLDFQ